MRGVAIRARTGGPLDPVDSLQLMVEADLALAGFAGIVSAVSRPGLGHLTPLHRMRLVNLLGCSLVPLLLSLCALVALAGGE